MAALMRWLPVTHHFIVLWFLIAVLWGTVFGAETQPYLSAAVIMSFIAGLLLYGNVSPKAWDSGAKLFYQACPVIVSVCFVVYLAIVTVWYTVWLPITAMSVAIVGHPLLAGGIGGGLMISIGISVVVGAWRTGPVVNWSLLRRMVSSLCLLTALSLIFLIALWRLIEVFVWFGLSLIGIGNVWVVFDTIVSAYPNFTTPQHATPTPEAAVCTGIIFSGFTVAAVWRLYQSDPLGAEMKVDRAERTYPTLYAVTSAVSAQFDIPTPKIAVTTRTTPVAFVTGVRPAAATFVVSEGLLDAVTDDELLAVIAHELAHIKNRDVMVMTMLTLPKRLFDTLTATTDDDEEPGDDAIELTVDCGGSLACRILRLPLLIVGYCVGAIAIRIIPLIYLSLVALSGSMATLSQPAIAMLSRAREAAADRAALRVTGSPASLASALQTVDETIARRPTTDLRAATSVSAQSILPPDPIDPPTNEPEDTLLGTLGTVCVGDGERADLWEVITARWSQLRWVLKATHPPTAARIRNLNQ